MAHLTDMEELLAIIPENDTRDFMREAMSCYMAGAYRGSIVLSYIALFDDLLIKLTELGRINSEARTISNEAVKRKGDQEVFESYLMDQIASKNLISGLDSSFLSTLRTLRNKSAHPSGHKPSAEEARFIFFESITRFLSRQSLSTSHLVDEILGRLNNTNFFTNTNIDDITIVVSEEISQLHELAIPQLIAKLIPEIKSTDQTTAKNASFFITGLAKLKKPEIRQVIQGKLLSSKSDNTEYSSIILQVISADGRLAIGLSDVINARIRAILATQITLLKSTDNELKLTHPTSTICSIISSGQESDVNVFYPEIERLFYARVHSEIIIRIVSKFKYLLPIYMQQLLKKAGSSSFEAANQFAGVVDGIDVKLGGLISKENSMQLILEIIKSSDGNAWKSMSIVRSKFSSLPTLRKMAIDYMIENQVSADLYVQKNNPRFLSASDLISKEMTPNDLVTPSSSPSTPPETSPEPGTSL